jgi:hypothetical protein
MEKFSLVTLISIFTWVQRIQAKQAFNATQFDSNLFQLQNRYRAKHKSTPPLRSHLYLQKFAQKLANKLAEKDVGFTEGSDNDLVSCGANYFFSTISEENGYQHTVSETNHKLCGQTTIYITAANKTDLTTLSCTPERVLESWYSSHDIYNYAVESNSTEYLSHLSEFTQLVWKTSIFTGSGVAINKEETTCYVIGLYWPAGNVVGRYRNNVMPASTARWLICRVDNILPLLVNYVFLKGIRDMN